MSFLIRKYQSFLCVCKHFQKHQIQRSERFAICFCSNFLSRSIGIHTSSRGLESTYDISPVCELLRKGGKRDCLSTSLKSIELTDALVEKVLLGLSEPVDAKKALLFFHWCSQQRKYQHGLRSYCIMVHILVRAGLVVDAKVLLESAITMNSEARCWGLKIVETLLSTYEVAVPGPRVFDLLIMSFSKLRMFEMALEGCSHLEEHGFSTSVKSFNTLLRAVQKSDQFHMVWRVFEYMVVKRKYPNQVTVEIMVDALCKGGNLQIIVDVLDRIHGKRCPPSVVVSTTLVIRIIEDNRPEEVILLLKRMLQKNLILDDIAYSLTIYAYCKMGCLEIAYNSLEEMLRRGHDANPFIHTSLIGVHCREGRMEEAKNLMQEMLCAGLKPYDETYNFLVEWSARTGKSEESLAFCTEMLGRGLSPSHAACNWMMSILCQDGEVQKANNILTVLIDKGFAPDEVTYSKLIDGFGKIGRAQEILKLYYEMEGRGPSPGPIAYASLVRSLCQCGKSNEAEKIATIMKDKFPSHYEHIETLLKGN